EAMHETVQGFKIIEAFNLHSVMQNRINASVDSIEKFSNKLSRAMNYSSPLMEALGGIAVALVVLVGGYQTIVLNKPPGQYISFIAAFLLAYEPAKRLTRLNIDLSNSLVGVRMLFEFLDLPERSSDERKVDIHISGGRIEFCDV